MTFGKYLIQWYPHFVVRLIGCLSGILNYLASIEDLSKWESTKDHTSAVHCRVGVEFFLIDRNRSTNQRSGMILEMQIQIFAAHARQIFHFQKIPGGPKNYIFFVKIGMKLPFTLNNKWRSTIWNLTFKKDHFGPPKKWVFGFWRKPTNKIFSSCFSLDSVLKTIDAQIFFWSVFLKTHRNIILAVFGG